MISEMGETKLLPVLDGFPLQRKKKRYSAETGTAKYTWSNIEYLRTWEKEPNPSKNEVFATRWMTTRAVVLRCLEKLKNEIREQWTEELQNEPKETTFPPKWKRHV